MEKIKKPSEYKIPDVVDDEEVQTKEFPAPSFEDGIPPSKFSSKNIKSSGLSAFRDRLSAMKKEEPIQRNSEISGNQGIPNISDIGPEEIKGGGRLINSRLIQANAKSSVKLNVPQSTKVKFPYLVITAAYDDDNAYLWDLDSKRFQLRYSGDIDILIDGAAMKKTKVNDEWGYVFYKNNKTYLDKLDELFSDAWREELQESLPEIVERNPDLLWEGQIQGKQVELYDYTDKSVCLFTDVDYTSFVREKIWMSNRYTHPTRGKVSGYCIAKRGKGIDKLREIIPDNFGMKYTKSAPVSTIPIKIRSGPSLIDKRNIEIEDIVCDMETYDYTDATFAIFFDPDVDLDLSGIMRNENLTINGSKKGGYTFNKTNKKIKTIIEEIAPGIVLESVKEVSVIEDPSLASLIPPTKEEKIEDILIKLLAKMSKIEDDKVIKVESRGKIFIYGNIQKISNIVEDFGEEYDLLLQGQISDTVGFQVLTKND